MVFGRLRLPLLAVFFVFAALPAFAQQAAGIKIQPSILEERVDPGETRTHTLRVTNVSSDRRTFYLIPRDIVSIRSDGIPEFAEGPLLEGGVASWVTLARTSLTLGSRQAGEVTFTIVVPGDAGPGAHLGGIIIATEPPAASGIGTAVAFGAGMILSLRVSGAVVEEASIREFRTDRSIYSRAEVQFLVRLENVGNALVRPRGPLEITDMFGKKVATLVVNDDAAAVAPKAVREFTVLWKGEGFAFGRYQTVLSVGYGEEEKKTVSAALSFWVLPLKPILFLLGGLAGLVLLLFFALKLYLRRMVRRMQEITGVSTSLSPQPRRRSFSRLAIAAVSLLLFTLIFLVLLFFFFA